MKESRKTVRRKTLDRLMVTKFIALPEDLTVEEGINRWRSMVHEAKITHSIYIVDALGRFKGTVTIRDLLAANPKHKLKSIVKNSAPHVYIDVHVEDVASVIIKHDLCTLPVLDHEGRLVGVVMADDILETIRLESNEDIYRLAGILGAESKIHEISLHLKEIPRILKSRILWVVVCVIFGVLASGSVVKRYEHVIATLPLLAAFIPVLTDTGGNIGTQSSTILVRALALGLVRDYRSALSFFLTDLGTSILMGAILTVFMVLTSMVWGVLDPMLLLILSVSMFLIPLVSALIGFGVPYLSYILKVDPAATSGPIVTSIADVTALLIYFVMVSTFYLPYVKV